MLPWAIPLARVAACRRLCPHDAQCFRRVALTLERRLAKCGPFPVQLVVVGGRHQQKIVWMVIETIFILMMYDHPVRYSIQAVPHAYDEMASQHPVAPLESFAQS